MTARQNAITFLGVSIIIFIASAIYLFVPLAPQRNLAAGQPDWEGFRDGQGSTLFTADLRPRPQFVNGPLRAARERLKPEETKPYDDARAAFESAANAASYNKCDPARRATLTAAYKEYANSRQVMSSKVIGSLRTVCREGATWCPVHIEGQAVRDVIADAGLDARDAGSWRRAKQMVQTGAMSMTDFIPGFQGEQAKAISDELQNAACKGGESGSLAGSLLGGE